jgi:type IV pilus assembly protein PilA
MERLPEESRLQSTNIKEVSMKHQPIRRLSVRRQRGQGMTEYIVIVALIAIAAIAVYQYFGQTVRNQTAAIAQELAGEDGTAARDKAGQAADGAVDEGKAKTLSTYTGNANTGAAGGN